MQFYLADGWDAQFRSRSVSLSFRTTAVLVEDDVDLRMLVFRSGGAWIRWGSFWVWAIVNGVVVRFAPCPQVPAQMVLRLAQLVLRLTDAKSKSNGSLQIKTTFVFLQ